MPGFRSFLARVLLSFLLVSVIHTAYSSSCLAEERIRAVVLRDLRPSSFLDPATGQPAGFSIDILNILARQLGVRIDMVAVGDWGEAEALVKSGKAELCPVMAISDERKAYFDFTRPIETFGLNLIVRADSWYIRGLADIDGKNIGVLVASQAEKFLKDKETVRLSRYGSYQEALVDLLSGGVDAFAGPGYVMEVLAFEAGIKDKIRVLHPSLKDVRRGIAFRKGSPYFARFDRAVTAFLGSPEYQKMYTKWFGMPHSFWTVSGVLWGAGIVLVMVALVVAVWRRRVLGRLNDQLMHETAERENIDRDLHREKERLELASTAGRVALWEWDIVSGRLLWSPIVDDMLGYQPGGLPRTIAAWEGLIHPEDHLRVMTLLAKHVSDNVPYDAEYRIRTTSGEYIWWHDSGKAVRDDSGKALRMGGACVDVTERRQIQEGMEQRVLALTRPLENVSDIRFEELFNIQDIQRIQDSFAEVAGVASIITHPDGTPITRPSRFCRLCNDIIRKTPVGLKNCYCSDAVLGQQNFSGPIVQPCLSGGLWDAGASITVGGRHVANWLIGQVRNEEQSEEKMLAYARRIGVDEAVFMEAFREVPVMRREQFDRVAKMLFIFAKQISLMSYQNVQQARFIADKDRMGRLLQENEKRLRAIFDQTFQFMGILDLSGDLIDVNSTALTFIGVRREDVINRPFWETPWWTHDREEQDRLKEAIAKAKAGETVRMETTHRAAGGALSIIDFTVKPFYGSEDGVIDWLIVEGRDITERRQFENMLSEQRLRLELALQAGRMGVWHWDVVANRRYLDALSCRLLGIDPASFSGDTDDFFHALHPDDRRGVHEALARVLEKNAPYEVEYRCVWPDRSVHHIASRGTLVNSASGRPLRLQGVIWDITEKKLVEQELRRHRDQLAAEVAREKEKLELIYSQLTHSEKMMSLGNLSAGVAHEINNPLGAILTNLFVLREHVGSARAMMAAYRELEGLVVSSHVSGVEKPLALLDTIGAHDDLQAFMEEMDDLVVEINASAERVSGIVKDLRIFARTEKDPLALGDLNEIIRSALNVVRNEVKYKAEVRLDLAVLPMIVCYPLELGQVMVKLLLNAGQAVQRGGLITVRTSHRNDMVFVEVQDNGCGIPLENLSRIFEPFFTTKEVGAGTGLGLAVAYGIIKRHDGDITVTSDVGKGTIFLIRLPIRPAGH